MSELCLKTLASRTSNQIVAVGKNYMKHVLEMGGSELPKSPVIFFKPWGSINYAPKTLSLPVAKHHQIDHQLQLGVLISKSGQNISRDKAFDHVGGYFLALDLTDRTLQAQAKKKGLPWGLAKGQTNFCPISPLFSTKQINPYEIELQMIVNEKVRQKDMTGNMHFKIDEVIEYISQFIRLEAGDLLLTGTPDGVGPLQIGDRVQGKARHNGQIVGELTFKIEE